MCTLCVNVDFLRGKMDHCAHCVKCKMNKNWTQNTKGRKMDEKWTKNGRKMDEKWTKNGRKMH